MCGWLVRCQRTGRIKKASDSNLCGFAASAMLGVLYIVVVCLLTYRSATCFCCW